MTGDLTINRKNTPQKASRRKNKKRPGLILSVLIIIRIPCVLGLFLTFIIQIIFITTYTLQDLTNFGRGSRRNNMAKFSALTLQRTNARIFAETMFSGQLCPLYWV